MARKGLKVEIEIPKQGGAPGETEVRAVEVLPLTVDQTLSLMESKAKRADGSPVMVPVFGRDGKPTGEERQATELEIAPWAPVGILQSSAHAEVALKIVRCALRKHPDIADRDDLGKLLDFETAAEISAHALHMTDLLKKAEAATAGEAKGP